MAIAASRGLDPARMFHPGSVSLSGAQTPLGQAVLANLRAGGFKGAIGTETDMIPNADLALVADAPENVPDALARHARMGARGAIVLTRQVPDIAAAARAACIRVLGHKSFGLVIPALGLNASAFPLVPGKGRMALVGQSSSIARTVIDWAVPNGVGFSHLIGIGGNTDIGYGLVLDHLSRDPSTAAIMVEIGRVRDPRLFFSAARAAARLRPVIAIAPGQTQEFLPGAMEATLRRAGVLLTFTIGEFLAAAETLTRVKPAHGESLAIVTNSIAIGRLAADQAVRSGLPLARLTPETRQVLALTLEEAPETGLIFAGKGPERLAQTAALLSAAPGIGGILVIHAPGGENDEVAIEALVACAQTVRIPLLIAAMGEESGMIHRHRLSHARLACFDTPEHAVDGFRHLLRNRQNRAAARELPDSTVLAVTPDRPLVTTRIAAARAAGQNLLVQDKALELVSAYGVETIATRHTATPDEAAAAASAIGFPIVIKLSHPDIPTHELPGSVVLDLPDAAAVHGAARAILARLAQRGADSAKAGFIIQAQAPRGMQVRIRVAEHPALGPVIGFGAGGGDPADVTGLATDLPPLNLPLAHALIGRAAIAPQLAAHRGQAAVDEAAIAAMLVRISQLVIDTPELRTLDLDPVFASARGAVAASARIRLRAPDETRPPLVITPYPAHLTRHYECRGMRFTLRPIRPEDADAHAEAVRHFSPEDMRFRFFSALKTLPLEQITRLTDVDYTREMAFIAVNEANGATMGTARLVRNDTDGQEAEFAVAVIPEAKGLGLGTALMRAALDWAKTQGIREVNGQILADNAPMLAFTERLGFVIHRSADDTEIMEARLALAP